jgi:hypothetical protein
MKRIALVLALLLVVSFAYAGDGDIAISDARGNKSILGDYNTTTKRVKTDSSGNLAVAGTGTAGTAAGGVLSVQGVASMTPVIVTGDSTGSLTVDGAVTVSATDLDIRALSSGTDSVAIEGGNTSDVKVTLDSESVAVTGTFWQETQPVSIATMPSTPVTGAVTVTNDTAANLKVDGSDVTQPVTIAGRTTTSLTAIDAVTLDNDPTSVTSSAITISEYQRVGVYWTYDETEVEEALSGTLTITVSPDGTTYFSAPFFDTAGGATPQTSEVLSDDGSYICWLDSNIPFAYMKVTVTGTNTDADDTIETSVVVYMDK